jgi:hypothetical protein
MAELNDHLADLTVEEERKGLSRKDAEASALARLGELEELAGAMIERRELQAWSRRVPWAVFGLGGLASLSVTYGIACLILWSGWRIFLPGSPTPFVRLEGLAIPYFGMGRLIYYGAPVFVGWALCVIAGRQRVRAGWPMVGIVLACVVGAMAQVRVGAVGSIGLAIAPVSVTYLAGLIVVAALPYLVWRVFAIVTGGVSLKGA